MIVADLQLFLIMNVGFSCQKLKANIFNVHLGWGHELREKKVVPKENREKLGSWFETWTPLSIIQKLLL